MPPLLGLTAKLIPSGISIERTQGSANTIPLGSLLTYIRIARAGEGDIVIWTRGLTITGCPARETENGFTVEVPRKAIPDAWRFVLNANAVECRASFKGLAQPELCDFRITETQSFLAVKLVLDESRRDTIWEAMQAGETAPANTAASSPASAWLTVIVNTTDMAKKKSLLQTVALLYENELSKAGGNASSIDSCLSRLLDKALKVAAPARHTSYTPGSRHLSALPRKTALQQIFSNSDTTLNNKAIEKISKSPELRMLLAIPIQTEKAVSGGTGSGINSGSSQEETETTIASASATLRFCEKGKPDEALLVVNTHRGEKP